MTNEQLVNEIQRGINRGDNLEALYTQNIKFIRLIIFKTLKRSNIPDYVLDDLMQIGYLALEKAATKYKSSKGVSFISYLGKYIRGYILRYGCPSSGLFDNNISLDTPIKDGEAVTIADTLADDSNISPSEAAEGNYLKCKLWNICKDKLTDKENEILIEKYKYCKTLKAIAIENGIPSQEVQRNINSSLRKLRKDKDTREIGKEWGYFYFRNIGIAEFNRTWTSSVELAVLKGLDYDEKLAHYK